MASRYAPPGYQAVIEVHETAADGGDGNGGARRRRVPGAGLSGRREHGRPMVLGTAAGQALLRRQRSARPGGGSGVAGFGDRPGRGPGAPGNGSLGSEELPV